MKYTHEEMVAWLRENGCKCAQPTWSREALEKNCKKRGMFPTTKTIGNSEPGQTHRGAVVIASRTEPLLGWTVKNIRNSGWTDEIICVHDGWEEIEEFGKGERHISTGPKPVGCPIARQTGIEEADKIGCTVVIVIDAHMSFRPQVLNDMMAYAIENPTCMVGCWSGVLNHTNLNAPHAISRHAACIPLIDHVGNVLQVSWVKGNERIPTEPEEVQCLLGACYCFTIQRYKDIGEPWNGAYGWGTSEQALCMFNSFAGGKNMCMPLVANHVYRDVAGSQVPYPIEAEMHSTGRVFNRMRLIQMLPMPAEEKVRLMGALAKAPDGGRRYKQARDMWERTPRKDAGVQWSVTWEEYAERWWTNEIAYKSAIPGTPVFHPGQDKPKEIAPPRQPRQRPQRTTRRAKNGRFKAGENPSACPACGSPEATVRSGSHYLNGWYKCFRKCSACNKLFQTMRKV